MARGISRTQSSTKLQKANLNFSAWIEVDLDALKHNFNMIQSKSQAQVLPILKSNAYGHGAPVVAAFLQSRGCSLIGVSSIEEALEILKFTKAQILTLTPPLAEQVPLVVKYGLLTTVTDPQQVINLARVAKLKRRQITVHIKVDTGFGRLGTSPHDFIDLALLVQRTPFIKLGGVFTHFPQAATNSRLTLEQLNKFLALKSKLEAIEGQTNLVWHAANSAAFSTIPASHLDAVRVGTLLYGQAPLRLDQTWQLAETWRFKTRIIQIKTLPKGHAIGYGGIYHTKKPTRVGVIPVGYSHGLDLEPQSTPWRQLKHIMANAFKTEQHIFASEGSVPILGRISMGLSCVDLSAVPELKVGDELVVSMRRVTADKTLPRIYYLDGQIKCIFWNGKVYNNTLLPFTLRNLF